MENPVFKTFPSSDKEFIAMLYLQQQDLSGKTVSEITDMYYDAIEGVYKTYSKRYPRKPANTNSQKPTVLWPGLSEV